MFMAPILWPLAYIQKYPRSSHEFNVKYSIVLAMIFNVDAICHFWANIFTTVNYFLPWILIHIYLSLYYIHIYYKFKLYTWKDFFSDLVAFYLLLKFCCLFNIEIFLLYVLIFFFFFYKITCILLKKVWHMAHYILHFYER
jgi:hypothetical protein